MHPFFFGMVEWGSSSGFISGPSLVGKESMYTC